MNQYGICFGGYCPMHRGHLDVIMKAKKECERVFVIVCGYDDEPRSKEIGLDLNIRYQLVKQLFKNDEQIKVMKVNDTELGLDESMSKENWMIWTEHVERTICNKIHEAGFMFKPIYYVAERFYKKNLDSINKKCICIDRTLPISGTAVRKQPILFFDKIVKTFQPYFVRNILIIGTASEGKTTLVKDLSTYFNIPKTIEYGRIYMEERNITDVDLIANDFHQFISGQYEEYKKAVKNSTSGVTIQDTDNLVTLMYAWAYTEDPNININENDYKALCQHAQSIQKYFNWDHIFILTPNNSNFVDDGTRYMAQASIEEREKNMDKLNRLIDEFGYDKNKITYLKGGEFENNFNIIKEYINGIFIGN